MSTSHDKKVKLWDPSGNCAATWTGHGNWVHAVAVLPGGARVVTGSADKTVKLWETDSGACLATWQGHEDKVFCVACSPSGTIVASGSSGAAWDSSSRRG